jgi:hypothetical protein
MTMLDLLLTIAKTAAAIAMVILAVSQIYRPWTPEPSGDVIRQFRLPLWARMRLHSFWLMGAAILVGLAVSPLVEIGVLPLAIVGAGAVAIAVLPVRYTITSEGIYVGRTPLRRWTQFAGLAARNGWIFLQPVAGSSGLLVRSPGGEEGDALLAELRGLVRRSYKGESSFAQQPDVAMGTDGTPEVSVA